MVSDPLLSSTRSNQEFPVLPWLGSQSRLERELMSINEGAGRSASNDKIHFSCHGRIAKKWT